MNYDNNNKISIFKNDKKGNEKAPDYRGTTTLNSSISLTVSSFINVCQFGVNQNFLHSRFDCLFHHIRLPPKLQPPLSSK